MSAITTKSLQEWLAWLETLHPSEIELGLNRIKTVADRLNINPFPAKVIMVAGTNGKGSFVCALQQLLLASGARVGAYTSPHLQHYNERVCLNGAFASDDMLCQAFDKIDQARGEISLTYFEFGTLAAFLIFQEAQVDYWLCEIGLGGRLDAVNILDPHVAVITSIDLDHQQWLGNTREEIAKEKCGILRENGRCVFAESNPPSNVNSIFNEMNVQPYLISRDFSVEQVGDEWKFLITPHENNSNLLSQKPKKEIHCSELHLPPDSVAAALQTYSICLDQFGLPQPKADLEDLLSTLRLSGRFQIEQVENLPVILDVAHNPAASTLLTKKLSAYIRKESSSKVGNVDVIAVLGMMADKDIQQTLRPLVPVVSNWCIAPIENMPRSATADMLESVLLEEGVSMASIEKYSGVDDAYNGAIASAHKNFENAIVLCTGSFFTVAPILQELDREHNTHSNTGLKENNG